MTVRAPRAEESKTRARDRRGHDRVTNAAGIGAALRGRVQGPFGQPLHGAEVCLLIRDKDCCSNASCALTDASGDFQFDIVEENVHAVLAAAAGYSTKLQRLDGPPSATSPILLQLAAGKATITGHVVDALGGVVPGAWVSARARAGGALAGVAASNDQGYFALSVPHGPFEIHAEAEAYSRVRADVVAPAKDVVLEVLPASALHGQVVTASGSGVRDVTVMLRSLDGASIENLAADVDEHGRFRLEQLSAGRYEIEAAGDLWRSEPELVSLGVGEADESLRLTVGPAALLDGVIKVDGEPCASGYLELRGPATRFEPATTEGRVRVRGLMPGAYEVSAGCSAKGQALISETLEVPRGRVTRDWELKSEPMGPATEDETCCEPVGTIRVIVADEARASGPPPTVTVVNRRWAGAGSPVSGVRQGNLQVFAGLELAPYDVYLDAQPEVRQRVHLQRDGEEIEVRLDAPVRTEITGHVIDESGEPIPDVWVHAANGAANTAYPMRALTGADGSFSLPGLLPGSYTVRVETALGRARASGVRAGTRGVALQIRPSGSLQGEVTSAAGVPETFKLLCREEGAPEVQHTAGVGRWSFAQLPAGNYELVVIAGSGVAARAVRLEAGATLDVTLSIMPGPPRGVPEWANEHLHRYSSVHASQ